MGTILNLLKSRRILVSDGAWGTLLQARGLKPGTCPESWNLDHPDEVLGIALQYIEAGADIIETNSFGGTRFKLAHYGFEKRVTEINQRAAEISRKAAGKDKVVMGSVGPTGKILMTGEISEEELYDAFREQCRGLSRGGTDAIVVETMSDLDEARIAVKAALENTACEVLCTMTFEKTLTGVYRTMMGISPTEMVSAFKDTGVACIGANCGNGIAGMIDIVMEIRATDKTIPILIQANAGIPQYVNGKTIFPESPEEMAKSIPELVTAGANIIGGCCGTTPAHIRLMADLLKKC